MPSIISKTSILNYLREHYQEFTEKYQVEKIGLFVTGGVKIRSIKAA